MSSTDSPWNLTNKEFSHFFAYFHSIVPNGDYLSGSRALEFFMLSNLPVSTLSLIWDLADHDEDGALNGAEFAVALNLCQLAIDGLQPPPTLPDYLQVIIEQTTQPDKHVLPMKQNQMEKCMSVFMSFVENAGGGQGYLAGEAAKYLLTNSQLPKAVLFHIWKLADMDKDGRLTFKEFVLAMHLVFIAKLNHVLPLTIDPAKVLPQEFGALDEKVAAQVDRKPLNNKRDETRPSVPSFATPINNPCILPIFKEIQLDRFANGKFDDFHGNPFRRQEPTLSVGSVSYSGSSQDDTTSSRRSSDTSYTESADVSKISTSTSPHSSVRSLAEERGEKPTSSGTSGGGGVDLQEVTQLVDSTRREGYEDNDDGEMDDEEKERMEQELDAISKVNDSYLKKSGSPGSVKVDSNTTTGEQNNTHSIVLKQTETKPTVTGNESPSQHGNQSPNKHENKPPSKHENESTSKPENKSPSKPENQALKSDIDLSFLDDIEAQVMDVLDDTNTFDPSKVAPPKTAPPQNKPLPIQRSSPSVSNKSTSSSSIDDTDSAASPKTPMSPSKSKTLPLKKGSTGSLSPFEIRTRIPSDSDSYRRNTLAYSPRRRPNSSKTDSRSSVILDDLDNIFSDELAQIDGIMSESKNKQEERKKRMQKETKDLKDFENKVPQTTSIQPTVASMEEVTKRRDEESIHKQKQWEKEVETFTASGHADKSAEEKVQLLNDETIQGLEAQFKELIQHEAEQMKGARTIRAQRLKEIEQEELERKEKMRREWNGKSEVTIEEWIQMMEENKLKAMSSEEKEQYQERKRVWLEERRRRDEEKKRIEEEKLQKNRERMQNEYIHQLKMQAEIESARLSREQLNALEQEQLVKEAEGRKQRSENARIKMEELKQREIENSKPKAKSGIAAKWEEQVKGRNIQEKSRSSNPKYLPSQKTASERELERLSKRVGNLS